ncbi:hypothetical protein D3C78_1038080 [compost metagenome]
MLQTALGAHGRQFGVAALQLLRPVLQRRLALGAAGIGLQLSGPVLERGGLGRQYHRLPGCTLLIGQVQVFQQDAPGHAVHHQVMGDQQQALLAIAQRCQQRTQQRALGKVEATLQFAGTERQRLAVRNLGQGQAGRLARLRVMCLPLAIDLGKAQAQAVVVLDQHIQRLLQPCRVQRFQGFEQH